MRQSYEHCIRCTICVENCPVYKVNPAYPGPKQAGPDTARFRLEGEKKVDKWISLCTQCGRCSRSCPHGVDPAALILKAQIAYREGNGAAPAQILFANFHFISHLASFFAPLANFAVSLKPVKKLMKLAGLREDIPFPRFYFRTMQREKIEPKPSERKAVFFHGCYLNGNAPDTGRDIVSLMQDMGVEVIVPPQVCCGLPAMGNGDRKKALSFASKNGSVFGEYARKGYDILYSCTSCGHTLVHTYPELLGDEGEHIAEKSWNIYDYLVDLISRGEVELKGSAVKKTVAYHIPCHLRGTGMPYPVVEVFKNIPGIDLRILDEHCCGFSGSYGFKEKNRETARRLGQLAVDALEAVEPDVIISDCGACRMQIENYTDCPVADPADILKEALQRR